MAQAVKSIDAVKISVRGVVQGVGFRPFIYQLAWKYGLKGWVCNTSGDVTIEENAQDDDDHDDFDEREAPLAQCGPFH